MASSLTSDQVNYLIWRYLQESGFEQLARSFGEQTEVDKLHELFGPYVRIGWLIYLIQRGLQYEELAARVDQDGTIRNPTKPAQFFPPVPSVTVLDEDEGVGPENGHIDEDEDAEGSIDIDESAASPPTSVTAAPASRKHGQSDGVNGSSSNKRRKRERATTGPDGDTPMGDAPSPLSPEEPRTTNGPSVAVQQKDAIEITDADTLVLGQDDDVSTCAWNSVQPRILATGGTNSLARIWNLPDKRQPSTAIDNIALHAPSRSSVTAAITALSWSPYGDRLATACADGETRIWSIEGKVEHTLALHYAGIYSLAWNESGSLLAALACDGKLIIWNTDSGDPLKHDPLEFQNGETIVDMEWIDNVQYLVSGDKGSIGGWFIAGGEERALYEPEAHSGEVSCIRWDSTTKRAASAGSDAKISLWERREKPIPKALFHSGLLEGHGGPVCALAWQPKSEDSPASPRRILASASEDCTIRIWDTLAKECLNVLRLHPDPIERISFSLDGSRLASGANGMVVVWKTQTGDVTHVYDRIKTKRKSGTLSEEGGEVTQISWNEEDALCVAFGEGPQKGRASPGQDGVVKTPGQCTIIRLETKASS